MPIHRAPRALRRGAGTHATGRTTPAVLATALTTALTWSTPALAHGQAAEDAAPTTSARGVDPTIRPGDDFFAYANGGWLRATRIPPDRDRWGARDEIEARTRRQVATLLDDARGQAPGSTARKVADFRGAYLNEAVIEARGLAPVRPLLDSVDRVRDRAGLTRLLGGWMRADVDPLNYGVYESSHVLGLSVEPGDRGETTYVAFLLEGGLGLPERADYLDTGPAARALRARYRAYIGRLLASVGTDRADRRADAVMALETAIARSHATPQASANDHNADNRWTVADFVRRAPGIDWPAFFAAAKVPPQAVLVAWQPSAITGAATLVASEPLSTWKDYLRFHLIDEYADVLPHAIADRAWAMHGAAPSGGPPGQSPRVRRATEATEAAMSDAIGRMYVERHFQGAHRARVQAIVANVVAAFERRVEAVPWMSPATKALALAKLRTLYIGVGYPEHWPDYSRLVIDAADALGNLRRVADWRYRRAVARIGQPVDRTEWWIAPQTVGAVLIFQQNAYDFSAALLQAPKFDSTASDAAAYGAIGAIIGHDVTHYVDVLGAEYDTAGALRHWWTPGDMARFQTVAEPLVAQFSGYHPFPDVAVNGALTRTENVADLGGLAAAFDAYRRTLGARATDRDYVRRRDREFFIAFAQSWRGRVSDTAMRTLAASSDHAPERYRVATVRNLDAWYDAFDVHPGQRLYLAPGARVRVW